MLNDPEPKPRRVVLDSSSWVRLIRSKATQILLFKLVKSGDLIIISSEYILDQIERGLYQGFGLTIQKAKRQTRYVRRVSEVFEPQNVTPICRDPSDDEIIALAYESKCDSLVAHDKDILELKKFKTVKIISTQDFINQMLAKALDYGSIV